MRVRVRARVRVRVRVRVCVCVCGCAYVYTSEDPKLNFEALPGTPEKLTLKGRFEPLLVKWRLGALFELRGLFL